jgi:hypothetical protein
MRKYTVIKSGACNRLSSRNENELFELCHASIWRTDAINAIYCNHAPKASGTSQVLEYTMQPLEEFEEIPVL